MSGLPITIRPLADSTLLVDIGKEPVIAAARSAAVTTLAQHLIDLDLPGVSDIIPAYTTILIEFELDETDITQLESAIHAQAAQIEEAASHPIRVVTIPVCYGGEHGPDLVEVAKRTGLTEDDVIALHSGPEYFVACMGFSPGWAYLLGLPDTLALPRRDTPRVRVPAGSVAIGGGQTGVYPMPTPGGWWLLGQTPARLFDLRREPPFALEPGDAVRFQPIEHDQFAPFQEQAEDGELVATIEQVGGRHEG
jgi:inhibitor of KinA